MEIIERKSYSRLFDTDELTAPPHYSIPSCISAFNRPTILIFEESLEMQDHYNQFLKSNFNLLMVESARYGIQMLQSLPVDLILLNVEQDHEKEAIGMLKLFRRIASGALIPVIAMTGYSGSEETAMLHKAHFDAYVQRPFTLRRLKGELNRCIAKRTISILNRVDLSAC